MKRGKYVVFRYLRGESDSVQVAIIVSAKVGNATVRNKVRRRLKEILKSKLSVNLKPGRYLVIAKKEIVNAKFYSLQRDVIKLIQWISEKPS